jgi:peptide/nickel transport system permease protein
MRLLPGDPLLMLMSKEQISTYSEEQLAELRYQYGLDKPVVMQYFDWCANALRGDFGTSIAYGDTVTNLLVHRIPITLHVGLLAFIVSQLGGILTGIISAVRRGTWLDTFITTLANIGITIPIFWLGVVLVYIFAVYLNWLPVMGYTSPFDDFVLSTKKLIMPVFCMAIGTMAWSARQTRSSMLEIIQQDYIRTAWSKGLNERTVIMRHSIKNAFGPVITMAGLGLSTIIGGTVLVETVFNIPGMGRLVVSGITNRDYPLIQGAIMVIAASVIFINLMIDFAYSWLDPRIRYS